MPYQFSLHMSNLLWVELYGQMELDHAESYFHDIWRALDECRNPTNMLVDGRRLHSASHAARRRTEQVAHHPHLGHIAFVVSQHHLLLFAPLVRFVSGVSIFGNEQEALTFLSNLSALPAARELPVPRPPEYQRELSGKVQAAPEETDSSPHHQPHTPPPAAMRHNTPPPPVVRRPAPASKPPARLTDMVHDWARNIESFTETLKDPRRR
ncbi:MAG: STAS/SEC14 domain-containing protein [Chloroflexales bacterium]|nr:STAS/SEC14 domain-containing protein [Chloroflexales bacterium]